MATFSVTGKEGQQAKAAVIAMAPGNDFQVINILRQESAGLPVLSQAEMAKMTEEIQIGPSRGKLLDMTGKSSWTNTVPRRILVAVLPTDDRSWFVSMIGDDGFVREQKPVFLQFLKSISIHEDGSQSQPSTISGNGGETPPTTTTPQKSEWNVPANWRELPASQFLLAKFLTTGDAGTKAEISISSLAGNGGGILANVNRWRNLQLGLSAATESDLPQLISTLDASAGKAMLVDMTGKKPGESKNTRIVGAILPQGDRTWFFKMMGDDAVVAREKAAFTEFVRTVKVPDAP